MIATISGGRVISQDVVPIEIDGVFDLIDAISRHRIDTLICGGIDRDTKESVLSAAAEIVDNVACSVDELVPALEAGALAPGFRLPAADPATPGLAAGHEPREAGLPDAAAMDCLLCRHRVCLTGGNCLEEPVGDGSGSNTVADRMIETAFDIAQEQERKLCRIAETVYFCLEMDYRRIGVAFCTELLEPARILTGVLRRFFEVVPICCRVGGSGLGEISGLRSQDGRSRSSGRGACNPLAQAQILNQRETDFNLVVGLCIGADSVFAQASQAPVSTLFVKDRSLANNPIGALYSDYYLRESVSPAGRGPSQGPAVSGSSPLINSALMKEER
jgi:uncharacterized metal-binding protein